MRFDLAVAHSGIDFNDMAGTASGTFPGSRWLASGGLTGTYRWQALVFQPSARIYALWEHEDAYTDSLGTIQNDRNFSTGRASGGVKVSYPFIWSGTTNIAPYAGIYGDYYFTSDDASTAGLASIPLLQGWSARFTSGLSLSFGGGGQLSFGGELGGIGGNTQIWTFRGRGSVPF
jgi:outer membrane autotransporter protein